MIVPSELDVLAPLRGAEPVGFCDLLLDYCLLGIGTGLGLDLFLVAFFLDGSAVLSLGLLPS